MVPLFCPRRLVFSGGGTRCLVFLSALRTLERAGHLKNVAEWWGTSAGALVAALYAITGSVDVMSDMMRRTDFLKFRDVNVMNLMHLTSAWGMDDGFALVQQLEALLESYKAGASQITFSEVPGLHIPVADLNEYKTVVCSAETFPTLRVVDAIRASMSLPLFYRPFKSPVNGHIWVDGGLRAHFPWGCLPSDDARRDALGFTFEHSWMNGPRTFAEYMFSILQFDEHKQVTDLKRAWPNILWFSSPPFPAWFVRFQAADYALLDRLGLDTVNAWFTQSLPRISECRPLCEDPRTPSPESHPRDTDGMLESRESHCPSQPQGSSRDLSVQRSRSFRRWSV